jgi:hypothetical protein
MFYLGLENGTFSTEPLATERVLGTLQLLRLMTTRTLHTLLLIALAGSQLAATPPPDAEATKLLVGDWVVPPEQYTATSKAGGFTFRPDGTFSSYGVFHIGDKDLRIEVEGKWSVKDGLLIEELTKSSQPQMAPVGTVTKDTLLGVTDKEYRFRTEQGGVEHSYVRK